MGAKIVDWDELYPGRFLKAGLLKDGEKRILLVNGVDIEPLEGSKGIKDTGILSFAGETKQMTLNKTNGICLKAMFGRVPWKWEGHRFAIFASVYGNDPCIRIWGSPELTEDLEVTIELPRKKPFTMTMHAMSDGKPKLAPVPKAEPKQTLSPECAKVLKDMGAAGTVEALMDIEADIAMRTFSDRETALLSAALVKRKGQLGT